MKNRNYGKLRQPGAFPIEDLPVVVVLEQPGALAAGRSAGCFAALIPLVQHSQRISKNVGRLHDVYDALEQRHVRREALIVFHTVEGCEVNRQK
jgi:hypothetical protein